MPDSDPARLIVPVGHAVGVQLGATDEAEPAQLVRRGASFHELTAEQFAVWTIAHGSVEAIRNETPWVRRAVEELAGYGGIAGAAGVVDGLLELGLLREVSVSADLAADFAKEHRLVPIMLGLGNTAEEPMLFGIGFLNQPVVRVGPAVYDLWQWSAMDDTLWAACESAADAARRGGMSEPEITEAGRLLGGLLGTVHVLLVANAAYVDIDFRLRHPEPT